MNQFALCLLCVIVLAAFACYALQGDILVKIERI